MLLLIYLIIYLFILIYTVNLIKNLIKFSKIDNCQNKFSLDSYRHLLAQYLKLYEENKKLKGGDSNV